MRNFFLSVFVCAIFLAPCAHGVAGEGESVSNPYGSAVDGQFSGNAGEAAVRDELQATADRQDDAGDEPSEGSDGNRTALSTQDGTVYRLEAVRVVADRIEAGKATIAGEELQTMPTRTGSVTEALKVRPNVQFSREEASSLTTGEIRPPRVSISGAKPYENNFLIDGMSVSNTFNPNGLNADREAIVPNELDVNGADQTIFYESSLVDTITVYTSNVPAKYGNFLGGVVDAELVDPRMDRWHAVFTGGHSRSEWFDLRGVDEYSEDSGNQPRFRSYFLQAVADGPLSANTALLLSASQRSSVIPLKFEEVDGSFSDKDQKRGSENFFARLLFTPHDELKVTLDGTYAPYMEKRWKPNYADSDWETRNEAFRLAASASLARQWGELTGRMAFTQDGFSRDSSTNFREQKSGLGVPVSEQFFRGGIGDAEVTNRGANLGADLELEEIPTGDVRWLFSTGAEVSSVTTDMWNEEARVEIMTVPSSGRWLKTETDYPESDQSRTLNTLGGYAQAEVGWWRFTLTPGLRLDYDDFSFNTNLAPRFKAEFDTMGDGALRLVAGVNRYYGAQLRAYAFDRYRPSFSRRELYNGSVSFSEGIDKSYLAKGLDTPYSDEIMGGIVGEVLGFDYGLEAVHRDHRDQIISKALEKDVYTLTNDGKSSYDGIELTLSRSFDTERFGSHAFTLGVSRSWTETFNGAYDSDIDVYKDSNGYEYDYDRVYYDGDLIDRSEMPADDYSSPTVVTLTWLGSFFEDRFRVNCVNRWRDSTTGLLNDSRPADETPYGTTASRPTTPSAQWLDEEGRYHDAYRKGIISGGLVTDVSLELDAVREEMFTVSLLLDVFNVFASDGYSFADKPSFTRIHDYGRGYYAGIRCTF